MAQTHNEMIKIDSDTTYFDAYLARPEGAPRGGVVVIQEIFGVNADIRATANWLAEQGYMAIAPDLFWRQTRNVSLTDKSETEWQQAFQLMTNYDADAGVTDIQASIDCLRIHGCSRVATIGFCLGGRMAYLAACHTDAQAHASYYGVGIQDMLAEASRITAPILIHIAGQDEFVPPSAQAAISEHMVDHDFVTVHIYDEQNHAFARHNGMHYDAKATDLAHQRTLALFAEAVG